MRILVLTHNYPRFPADPAGAFVARLCRAIAERGVDVRVVTPHVPGAAAEISAVPVDRFRYAPSRLERIGYAGDAGAVLRSPFLLLAPFYLLRFHRAVQRAVRSFRPHLVHAHWWLPSGFVASRTPVPYVVTCHGTDVRMLEKPWFRAVGRRVLRRGRLVTTVSEFLARDVRELLREDLPTIRVARMPVDVGQFARGKEVPKADPPRILYAGNLVHDKGVDTLLRAYAALRSREVPCQLRILGEGNALDALRRLASRLGVLEAVEWSPLVPQSRMPSEYGASAVNVLPSRGNAEGLGLSLVEALLSGCAVVGSPAGGIPEIVRHEVTGLLVRRDDPRDLERQLERLLADGSLRERLTKAGETMVRDVFATSASAERFLRIYDEALDQRLA